MCAALTLGYKCVTPFPHPGLLLVWSTLTGVPSHQSLRPWARQPLPTCPALLTIIPLLTAGNPYFLKSPAVVISGGLSLQWLEAGFQLPGQRLKSGRGSEGTESRPLDQ